MFLPQDLCADCPPPRTLSHLSSWPVPSPPRVLTQRSPILGTCPWIPYFKWQLPPAPEAPPLLLFSHGPLPLGLAMQFLDLDIVCPFPPENFSSRRTSSHLAKSRAWYGCEGVKRANEERACLTCSVSLASVLHVCVYLPCSRASCYPPHSPCTPRGWPSSDLGRRSGRPVGTFETESRGQAMAGLPTCPESPFRVSRGTSCAWEQLHRPQGGAPATRNTPPGPAPFPG